MKRPNQKTITKYLKDIPSHFAELIDAMIWYEEHDMDDWATEIVGYIEKMPEEIELLVKDFETRKIENSYFYQKLWMAQVNGQSAALIQHLSKNEKLKIYLDETIQEFGSDTQENFHRLTKANKS